MTPSILRTLLPFSLFAIFGSVHAMAEDSANFKIPFDFTVGQKQLRAGEYQVGRLSPSILHIRTGEGQGVMITMANAGEVSRLPGTYVLKFDKVDNRYFLSSLAATGYGLELIKPAAERELIARSSARKPVVVVASRK